MKNLNYFFPPTRGTTFEGNFKEREIILGLPTSLPEMLGASDKNSERNLYPDGPTNIATYIKPSLILGDMTF